MTSVKSVNFYDLCRICTATTDQKIDIFSLEGKTKKLCEKINDCLSLNIDEKDRLPKVLCPQCIQHLETYAEFRNICRNSQIMLTSCLNTASAQNGGKVLIKDILSSTGKSLSVFNNSSNSVGINTTANNMETSQNVSTQPINTSLTSQVHQQQQQQQQHPQQQQLFTIQGSNIISQSVVNPLTISASGTLQNRDFINSIMQAVGIQGDNVKVDKTQTVPQYTITVDNTSMQQQGPTQTISEPVTKNKDKETKTNALEEFLKMKPNIKVTPISKKQQSQQQQQQSQQQQQQSQQQYQQNPQQQQEQQLLQQQQHELHQQQIQQQEQQQQQNQLVQFQLQQLLQQQLQQQQLQQQLQLLTSQLQPQQITITAPSLQQQTPTILQSTALSTENNLNENNDDQSPSKNKKPKLNFILTPPSQPTNQALSTSLPQLSTITTNATHSTTPQIQLQFQPTLPNQNSLQLQQTQQHQNAATAALLSNLAPLLHPQTQINAALQTQALNNVAQNTGGNILSPNKCFLPITIKDESTDQQFVAHIDAKNFLLPTTYQLQMKLQPQIATADGQPIMQLAPTSIPATLQIAPQTINTHPTFQAAASAAAFNTNSTLPTQMMQQQQQQQQTQQLQTPQIQQHILQHISTQGQQQPQPHAQTQPQPSPTSPKIQPQSTQILQLPKNAQITSQQVLTTGNKKMPSNVKNAGDAAPLNEKEKPLPKGMTSSQVDTKRVIKQQKYTISQQPGTNTIEITPTTSFTQQIMQQVQQQQQQKQKINQQQSSEESTTTASVTTQHGGITVQRIMTKNNPTAASAANGTNEIVTQSTRQATITPINQQPKQQTLTLQKLPILNKQNITISRITPQTQQYQSKPQSQQPHTTQIANTTLKVVHQPIKSQTITVVNQQKQEQSLPTRIPQQQTKTSNQQQSKGTPNNTLRISPLKKVIKKSQPKSAVANQTPAATSTATTILTNQVKQTENFSTTQNITTPASPTTQIHYITDITSVLPTSNNEGSLSTGTKISTLKMPSTTTITSTNTNSSNITNSGQTKSNLECSQCGRIFKKKEHLTQHVKLHSGVRPFKCHEDGCTKAFHRKEHLLRHLVSHSGKKMFSCDICQKPFSRKDNLSKHRKIHTDPNSSNYVCEFCNKSFAVKTYYEQHKILHQSKTIPEEDKKTVNETATKVTNQSNSNNSNNNNNMNQIEYQTQTQQHQQQQQTQQQQQLNLVQQQMQQLHQHNQAQTQQIMHLQLPTSIVTSQDMVGNTITITQANDPQASALKTLTLSSSAAISSGGGQNHHDATVLNLPTSLANFVQLSQAQFVNTTTGQIVGLKIQK